MSLAYRRRKKARLRDRMVEGEAQLRRLIKTNPEHYPRWVSGIRWGGQLIQKVFARKGTYTAKGQGKEVKVQITRTFPCISTIAYYRSTVAK